MKEIWKDIVGYEGYYQVSSFGRVKSLSRIKYRKNGKKVVPHVFPEKILRPEETWNGRLRVVLMVDKVKKRFLVHRLIALVFIPAIEGKPWINHKDGNPHNNKPGNLEWCTREENVEHAQKNGLFARGDKNGMSKLTSVEVRLIREKYEEENINQKELAKMFMVKQGTVSNVIRRVTWKHVK